MRGGGGYLFVCDNFMIDTQGVGVGAGARGLVAPYPRRTAATSVLSTLGRLSGLSARSKAVSPLLVLLA